MSCPMSWARRRWPLCELLWRSLRRTSRRIRRWCNCTSCLSCTPNHFPAHSIIHPFLSQAVNQLANQWANQLCKVKKDGIHPPPTSLSLHLKSFLPCIQFTMSTIIGQWMVINELIKCTMIAINNQYLRRIVNSINFPSRQEMQSKLIIYNAISK